MAAVAHLASHPELPRPTLRIGFTPDEEIGEGALTFDIERFGALCAYTLDGSELGELQDETFSALEAHVVVHGRRGPPRHGDRQARERAAAGGEDRRGASVRHADAETTARARGLHPPVFESQGTRGRAEFWAIVRDFDEDELGRTRELLRRTARRGGCDPSRARARDSRSDRQYRNMRPFIEREPAVMAAAEEAIQSRGDRAGAHADPRRNRRLAACQRAGLPTPNIFTGGHEYHSVQGVGLGPGDGRRRRDDRAPRGGLEPPRVRPVRGG